MAAPIAGMIQLPTDSGNTGKKVRTQTRVVGADTVHEHHFIPISSRKIDGIYYASSGVLATVAAADNGTTAARLGWLEMPVGGSKRGRLRQIENTSVLGAIVSADFTAMFSPISIARFTFTGTASGALITPARRHPSDAANVANLRTASTGMTVTLAGLARRCGLVPFIDFATAAGWISVSPHSNDYDPQHEDEYLDFGPGEGLVFYQVDAGNTGWRSIVSLAWDEYDNA